MSIIATKLAYRKVKVADEKNLTLPYDLYRLWDYLYIVYL